MLWGTPCPRQSSSTLEDQCPVFPKGCPHWVENGWRPWRSLPVQSYSESHDVSALIQTTKQRSAKKIIRLEWQELTFSLLGQHICCSNFQMGSLQQQWGRLDFQENAQQFRTMRREKFTPNHSSWVTLWLQLWATSCAADTFPFDGKWLHLGSFSAQIQWDK